MGEHRQRKTSLYPSPLRALLLVVLVAFATGPATASADFSSPGSSAQWLGAEGQPPPFASEDETRDIEKRYAAGIAWGEMKQMLFEYINEHMKPVRDEYERLIADPAVVEIELQKGAAKAREVAVPYIAEIRSAIGIRKLG